MRIEAVESHGEGADFGKGVAGSDIVVFHWQEGGQCLR